jgi:hypothetical protein
VSAPEVVLGIGVVLTGILAGNELGTLAVIHPALDRLDYASGRPAAQAIVGLLAAVVLLVAISPSPSPGCNPTTPPGARAAAASSTAIVTGMSTGITLPNRLPLNARQLGADAQTPEERWRAWRRRWLRLHAVRVVCDSPRSSRWSSPRCGSERRRRNGTVRPPAHRRPEA